MNEAQHTLDVAWSWLARANMRVYPLIAFTFLATCSLGQDGRIEVLHADIWEFDESVANAAQRLKGAVRFKHGDAVMRCDSAWLYNDQTVDAYGSIHIRQGDTLTITGDRLHYDGPTRSAILDGGVRMEDPGSTLTTEHLVYRMANKTVTYTGGGTIVSKREGDILTSGSATYLTDMKRSIFSQDVVLRHPQRTIVSDSMHFSTATGTVEFHGPTTIDQEGSVIRCTRGSYDTRTRKAVFNARATVVSDGQELKGDSLRYDDIIGLGEAWGDVVALDTANGTVVLGDHGRYNRQHSTSMVTGRAEMRMRLGEDTLFLHADSLFSFPDTIADHKRILARRGVRFYKNDLQGVCDTLEYVQADSVIRMYHKPVLWNEEDQISGTHIRILLRNGGPYRLFVEGNAFMASQVDSSHFDQVSGRTMTGHFRNDALDHLVTQGNSRTVYHAQEEKDGKKELIGVNKAECSSLLVRISEGEVSTVTFLTRPEAVMYPMDKAPVEEMTLVGFNWRQQERPVDKADIFRKVAYVPPAPMNQENGRPIGGNASSNSVPEAP